MEKTVVFDFDKTLTNYDTILPFFIFCCKGRPLLLLFLPLFIFIKILTKFNIISVQKEKEIGLLLFCPKRIADFKNLCVDYSKTIKLNSIYYNYYQDTVTNQSTKVIIASASFQYYLEPLFSGSLVIGTTLKINKKNKIIGICCHPFNMEKLRELKKYGITKIETFYTDSINDLPVVKHAEKTVWIKKGIIC